MHLHTYRDQSHCTHFDLIGGGGKSPRTIDLVSVIASSLLVIGFVCALLAPFASTVSDLSAWVH
jgi:hypothetical protein